MGPPQGGPFLIGNNCLSRSVELAKGTTMNVFVCVLTGAVLLLVAACSGSTNPPAPTATSSLAERNRTLPTVTVPSRVSDPTMVLIARDVPGFIRVDLDEERDVLLVQVTTVPADLGPLQSAIFTRFPQYAGNKIEIIDVAHEWHLARWQLQIESLPGWTNAGPDPSGDLLRIGVVSEEDVLPMYQAIADLGIPLEAVIVVATGKIVPL